MVKINHRINHRKMGCGREVPRNIIYNGFQPVEIGVGRWSEFQPYLGGCGHKFRLQPVNLGFARWRKTNCCVYYNNLSVNFQHILIIWFGLGMRVFCFTKISKKRNSLGLCSVFCRENGFISAGSRWRPVVFQ